MTWPGTFLVFQNFQKDYQRLSKTIKKTIKDYQKDYHKDYQKYWAGIGVRHWWTFSTQVPRTSSCGTRQSWSWCRRNLAPRILATSPWPTTPAWSPARATTRTSTRRRRSTSSSATFARFPGGEGGRFLLTSWKKARKRKKWDARFTKFWLNTFILFSRF